MPNPAERWYGQRGFRNVFGDASFGKTRAESKKLDTACSRKRLSVTS